MPRFMINDIINSNQQQQQQQNPEQQQQQHQQQEQVPEQQHQQQHQQIEAEQLMPPPEKHYYKIISSYTIENRWYKTNRHLTTFAFEELERSNDPQGVLLNCFNEAVQSALLESTMLTGEPDRLGITIHSERLEYPIWLPIQSIQNADIGEQLLTMFDKVNQSVKRGSLYGAVFTVEVTTVCTPALEQQLANTPEEEFDAGGHRAKLDVLHSDTNDGLILIQNPQNNYCLFLSLEMARQNAVMTDRSAFQTYKRSNYRQLQNVTMLFDATTIPRGLPLYSAKRFLPIVQSYYDDFFPGQFHLSVFTRYGKFKPIMQTGNLKNKHALAILLEGNGHFNTISNIRTFFGVQNYCFACKSSFKEARRHRMDCELLCVACRNYGAGPCLPDEHGERMCIHCGQLFKSDECVERHLHATPTAPSICSIYERCHKCGVTWNKRNAQNDPSQKHSCELRFCRKCRAYHGDRPCFIEPIRKRKIMLPTTAAVAANDNEEVSSEEEEDEEEFGDEEDCESTTASSQSGAKRPRKSQAPEHYRFIIYDFECSQDLCVDPELEKFKHVVDFVGATVFCTLCIDRGAWDAPIPFLGECPICGPHRFLSWAPFSLSNELTTPQHRHSMMEAPLKGFIEWTLKLNKKYQSYAFAHNSGRYDMMLILKELLLTYKHLLPDVIRQGNRLYNMTVKRKGRIPATQFKDSYNFISIALDKFATTFNLPAGKHHFPHLFNTIANIHCPTLNRLPPKSDYLYKTMTLSKRRHFLQWYAEHRNDRFDLKEKLYAYCMEDVKILAAGLISFRDTYIKECSFDPLARSNTLAGVVMTHFKMNCLQKNTIGVASELAYGFHGKQSTVALKFLKWFAHVNEVEVQDADSVGGEHRVGHYLIDGFVRGGIEQNGRDLAIEINGCQWHGCLRCYKPMDKMVTGRTAQEENVRTRVKADFIQFRGFDLHTVWTCEIEAMLRRNRAMKKFFDSCPDTGVLSLRDAFFGGRTGTGKLYKKATGSQVIKYKDFNSLYPATTYEAELPLGHPTLQVHNREVNWTQAKDNTYKGVIKAFVIPPNNLRVPVLPKRLSSGRLGFVLCSKCADKYPKGLKKANYKCLHEDKERGWIATVTHIELEAALQRGYRVTFLYRTLTWERWSKDLFKKFVRQFIRMKVEASGWPPHVTTDEQKRVFLDAYKRRGFDIDPEKMAENTGKRYIAKISNNSLWGRFSLRNNLSKSVFITSPHVYIQYLRDHKIIIQRADFPEPRVGFITFEQKEGYVEENPNANVAISLYVTSAARLTLFAAMEKVVNCPGAELLYWDTDSQLYSYDEDLTDDPLESGSHLGELVDELPPGARILQTVSAGSKQWGMEILNADGTITYVLKLRGITLNYNAYERLAGIDHPEEAGDSDTEEPPLTTEQLESAAFERFKNIVLSYANVEEDSDANNDENQAPEDGRVGFLYRQIRPHRLGGITTENAFKIYKPILTNAIITSDYNVIPFGFNQ